MNIVDVIKEETLNQREKTALIETGRRISYSELFEGVYELAEELKKRGIKPYQRIGLLCPDSSDYIVVSLAILSINAVIVPIHESLPKEEIDYIAESIDLDFIIFDKTIFETSSVKGILSTNICQRTLFMLERTSLKSIPDEYYKINPAFIRFSSGTTGLSKGVVLSHQTILERTDAVNKGLGITSQDKIIWVLSMSFHFTATIILFLRKAATIIVCGRQFPQSLFEALKQNKSTFIYASPIYYQMMINSDMVSKKMLANLRMAVSTAIRLPEELYDKFYQKLKVELCEAYGIIEIGIPFINYSGDTSKRGSVGRILDDYEVKLENPDSEGVGKICLRGKGMFDAYFSPWQKREEVAVQNWFNTGDLGRLDNQGFLFITGREKNIINFSGMKIFPYEVEAVLNKYPQVKESCVYPVDHSQYGQIPAARIVLHRSFKKNFDVDSLRRFCYTQLVSYKVPKEFHCVEELAKTLSGKIKR